MRRRRRRSRWKKVGKNLTRKSETLGLTPKSELAVAEEVYEVAECESFSHPLVDCHTLDTKQSGKGQRPKLLNVVGVCGGGREVTLG